jgi:predicted Mrr-cat superfamily restriction endonuclease
MAAEDKQAWVLRVHTGGGDLVEASVRNHHVFMGWSRADGLLDCNDYWQFREIVHRQYYSEDGHYRRSGQAASQLWNFVHEMREGDLVLVPHPGVFYAGVIDGPIEYEPDAEPEDTAHRRQVKWLNGGEPIPRRNARAALISRMRSQRTLTAATDLRDQIDEALAVVERGETPSLAGNLREALIETTKQQLLHGYMDSNRFEDLVRDLMRALGAIDARVVARSKDIGADIEADFTVAHLATVPVRVQAKYWRGNADRTPIDQVLNAMEDVDLGMVVTTADFDDNVSQYATERADQAGKQLVLIDGDELCRLIVDYGLDMLLAGSRA